MTTCWIFSLPAVTDLVIIKKIWIFIICLDNFQHFHYNQFETNVAKSLVFAIENLIYHEGFLTVSSSVMDYLTRCLIQFCVWYFPLCSDASSIHLALSKLIAVWCNKIYSTDLYVCFIIVSLWIMWLVQRQNVVLAAVGWLMGFIINAITWWSYSQYFQLLMY